MSNNIELFGISQPVPIIKSRSTPSLDNKNMLCSVGITRVTPSSYNHYGYQKKNVTIKKYTPLC